MAKKAGVFDTFSSSDLLRDGKWKGTPLTEEVISSIREEAQAFKSSQIWKILKAELQWFAIKSLLEGGKDGEDIRIARAFGNIITVIDDKLNELGK